MNIVLIGAGNMGSAMLSGLSNYSVTVVEKDTTKHTALQSRFENINIVSKIPDVTGSVVVLAIKPQVLNLIEIKGSAKAVISILAGTTLAKIRDKVDAKFYIRAMPNVAAMNLKSVTSVVGDIEFKEEALEILSTIGKTIWLNSEKELDIATGLAGSSPAWLAMVAEALADGAVNLGLPRDKAYEYLSGLFEGVGSLLESKHPALLKDIVTSPGGTTAAGLVKLESSGVRSAFIEAMSGCYSRAKELGIE